MKREEGQLITYQTYKSPQEPQAIFFPIFKHLLSISQSPTFINDPSTLSLAEERDAPERDP